jgi:hypothetical protein
MGIETPILVTYVATFVAVVIVVWLVFDLVWYLCARAARLIGAGEKADRLLDTNGVELPDEERIKDDGGFRGGIAGLPQSRHRTAGSPSAGRLRPS